jgi:hypothetical protein
MLPLPRAAILGAIAAVRKNGARTLVEKVASKVSASISCVGAKEKIPALLTRTSTSPAASTSRSDVVGVGEVRGDEARAAATGFDRGDGVRTALGVTADDDDLRTGFGELERRRATDARGRSGDEGALILEVHASSFRMY